MNKDLPEYIAKDKEAKHFLNEIDFTYIIDILTGQEKTYNSLDWAESRAKKAVRAYKNWLYLKRKYYSELLPPSKEVDHVWHLHMLFTERYHKDSNRIFGEYLHHFPYFGLRGKSDLNNLIRAFEQTKKLYQEEYNEEIP